MLTALLTLTLSDISFSILWTTVEGVIRGPKNAKNGKDRDGQDVERIVGRVLLKDFTSKIYSFASSPSLPYLSCAV